MLKRWAGVAVLPLLVAAVAEEPQQADWQAEEAALLKEAAERGITPDKKAAAAAMANERQGFTGFLPDADEHVLSHSKLFSVSGGDSLRMGAIATRADELYGQMRKLLQLEKNLRWPISIRLIGRHADAPVLNPVRTRINIIEGQPNFQVRIHPGGGIDLSRMDKAIIRMVLYQYALRDVDPEAYPDTVEIPEWLVAGVQQAVLWKSGKADKRVYRQLFDRAEMLSPEEVITMVKADEQDAASREVYEVSCGVLIMSLVDREGGAAQLKNLISNAALDDSPTEDTLTAHFHELGVDRTLLNKWWAVELAQLSLPQASDAMTPLETEKMLQEALTIMYFAPGSKTPRPVSLDNAYALAELPNWQQFIAPSISQLVSLGYTCFPGYRSIIAEYCRVIEQMAAGANPDTMQNSLLPLQELRRAYYSASIRGRDYLDWYEITFTGEARGRSFDSYLETMRLLRQDIPGPETPMSRYLDDIEALYTQKEGAPLPPSLRRQAQENRNTKTR